MKKVNPKLLIVYLFVLLSMTFSVWQLGISSAHANQPSSSGTCCQTSQECPGTSLCNPPGDLMPCEPAARGYCK